ncbi:anoctamin-8 [Schistocerca piceifrons]|uniref:anoctamin-8 n=1 Tax=Schistocerca piceifrons TaxID=274613 RepID=UPI001F5EE3B1|nr:anoctamin-8 [Schistocerca piceifrons]
MESPESENSEQATEADQETNLRHRKLLTCAKKTIENASLLLRRKIPCTGHLMTPRRLWIQTIPTQECDVVLMFPPGAQDFTLMWLLSRLRAGTPGLVVHVRHHASSDSYGFYLTAPFPVLLKAAEELHLPKTLKSEFGGGLKEFVQQEAACFEGTDNESTFFTTQERQWLVLHLLQTLRAAPGDQLGGLKLIEGQAIVPKCLSAGIISQVFPLHDLPSLQKLQKSWVRDFFRKQPLDDICNYFGVKITMYFAWLGHYTTALIVPAVVGLIFWVCFCGHNQAVEDVGYVLFSFFNVLWASVYVETWKRYSAELAYRWGTLDQRDELLVEPRPLFSGTLEVSPVTGRLEPVYPAWKRNVFRYFVSMPIILLCLAVVFIIMIVTLQFQDWWDHFITDRGYMFCLSYLPKIFLAVVITLLDEAYYKVACWLNDKENYRLDTKYENHLIVKVALFQFVNSFLSLFYIAFYLQDQEKLKEQLAALLIARQVIGNLKESALPYLLEQLRLAKLSFDLFGALSPSEAKKDLSKEPQVTADDGTTTNKTGNRNISQAELESSLFKYDGTFADHLEMFIQLGYVVLFSSAFPMAAFCALLNNLIEIRSDAFKLCFIFQRPFGQRVSNIGTWQNAMEVMCLIAVLVNCALIGLSGQVHRMFPEMSTTQTILLIVALEHIMLILRFLISCAIPDVPEWVATEMAKVEFARREACRRLSSTTASTPARDSAVSAPSTVIGRFVVSPANDENKEVDQEGTVEETEAAETGHQFTENATKAVPDGSAASAGTPDSLPSPTLPKSTNKRASPHEWLSPEGESLGYHLTIGPHGVDWVRHLGLEGSRKSCDSETVAGGSGENLATHRSTDCIVTPKELTASSDSDLLRSAPPWASTHPRPKFRFSPEKSEQKEMSLSDSSRTVSSQEGDETVVKPEEAAAAKKTRVKQSLMKRARSVAIFSLKLKERRAAREAKEAEMRAKEKWTPPATVGGELSCIPIEKLISVDDVAVDLQRRKNQNSGNM